MLSTRPSYTGTSKKLVLAFDIGTTYSGVSYTLLDPGSIPEIKSVSGFPGMKGPKSFKVSSTMLYRPDGTFLAGNDTDEINVRQVKWWKLKVLPKNLPYTAQKYITSDSHLPKGKSLQDVFADFISYLYDSARAFICEHEPMGEELWKRVKSNIDLILSHPNGWEGRQQEFLRKSVVNASIFTEEEALSRVSFVTEGEATFHYCVIETKTRESLKPGHKVLVIDAGGGSIDISSYSVNSTFPLEVEESHEPRCSYQGGEIVTARFQEWATGKLKNSTFCKKKQVFEALTKSFDTGAKTIFSDARKPLSVKFGTPRDNDPGRGVSGGMLSVPGDMLKIFFQPSVDAIVNNIWAVIAEADLPNTSVFLAGGFAASPWLFDQVKQAISKKGLDLSRPHAHTNKAVADGAISYYLDHFVVGRIFRHTYGIPTITRFDPEDSEHRQRRHKMFQSFIGDSLKVFHPTIFKGMRISGAQEFRDQVSILRPLLGSLGNDFDFQIIRYTGPSTTPRWMDEETQINEKYETVSHIRVDLEKVPGTTVISPLGIFSLKDFEVIYIYGGSAEIKAQVAWKEDGEEKRSDVAILYDDQ